MRTYFVLLGVLFIAIGQLSAQRECSTAAYLQNQLSNNPSLASEISQVETFIQQKISDQRSATARVQQFVIKIPVVVHILYHFSDENISNEKVIEQIDILNKCFRRRNADSTNTPVVFQSRAADCEIEFQLAISDPKRRSTSGIIHKYSPITEWRDDDKVKFSSEMGDDAWDTKSYLNIWVCNLRKLAGYSSVVGGQADKDGVVVDFANFGFSSKSGYESGKTTVHEVGHWLGLKHIWGDANCGDDLVYDTPTQSSYTSGCPTTARTSCNNASAGGDMYMNYMDYTNDACVNLFTEGQKERMRILFASGGFRNGILSSLGLTPPLVIEAPLQDDPPRWLYYRLYPNPAGNEIVLDIAYDTRWVGKTVNIFNANGQLALQVQITSKIQTINISKLKPGLYFISARKEDGSYIKQKFIKI